MTRWWGVALLALSVGLNAGLGVAVLQQRFLPVAPPAPAPETPPPPDAPAGWASPGADGFAGDGGADGVNAAGAGVPVEERAAGPPAGEERVASGATSPDVASPGRAADIAAAAPGRRAATATAVPTGDAAPAGPALQPEVPAEPHEDAELELAWAEPDAAGAPPGPGPPRPQGRPGDRFLAMPPEARFAEMAERLGVPPADRPRFVALQRRFFGETRDGRVRLDAVRRELRAELTAGEPDRARIDELLARSGELQAGLERALVDHVLAARELLDGEAERRYLQFLSRLGAAGGPGARQAPPLRRRPGLRPGRPPF